MENFIIILGIVMLAFGILQIVLFFKIWGMTNDVRRIRQHIGKEADQQREIMKAIYRGDPNLEQLLFDYAYSLLYKAYGDYNDMIERNPDSDYCLNLAAKRFERESRNIIVAYNKAGVAVPEVFGAIKSCKDFDAYFAISEE